MKKYHVHVYKVVGKVEVETLATNENKAREFALEYVKERNSYIFGESDCNMIAIEFEEIDEEIK